MIMKFFLIVISLILTCCYSQHRNQFYWPDVSFVVIDEKPINTTYYDQADNLVPSLKRVILLPIIENFIWEGKRLNYAITDPILVVPGKEAMNQTFSHLEFANQKVRRCIIMARGYCPGALQPMINWAGNYNGKEVWMIELPKVTKKQYAKQYEIIINELSGTSLVLSDMPTTGDIWNYEYALKNEQLLRRGLIKSPVINNKEGMPIYRREIVLWNLPDGMRIPICFTPEGRKLLKDKLMPN
jgi:hypothetical protein